MLIELGGSEVYLQDKGFCSSKWPWPALTKITLKAELYFLRHDLTARSAGQEFTDL
jgi:hypothetical protein